MLLFDDDLLDNETDVTKSDGKVPLSIMFMGAKI